MFRKFDENLKLTDGKISGNPKPQKYEHDFTKAQHNQLIQSHW